MKIKFFPFLLFVASLSLMLESYGNKSADEIKKEYSSGVVIVQKLSYYKIKFLNEVSFYFTSYNEEGLKGFTTEKDSIKMCSTYSTGFFVSEDGQIVTNHHEVSNRIDFRYCQETAAPLCSIGKKRLWPSMLKRSKERIISIEESG